ncbi:3'-5' exonuclease [Qipengyuania sp. MTN3-11]|uniref:3'-5' exonuclease n=1 Tax=Qipengyuania sp. MTN3-11 TaxID=3056557 RepID=UPI0036F2DBD1
MSEMISVTVDAEDVARSLDLHDDFRVLRRMREIERPADPRNRDIGRVGIAIDVETTGLDPDKHEVIELAVQRFRIDDAGSIIETGQPRSWFEQPSIPIPVEVERITGLTDADVAGRTIGDGEATSMIRDADFVVAHNASFDRPFVEARLPLTAGQPWICTLADVDWKGLGYQDRTLSGLLARMGCFYDAHRAQTDVSALLHLLDHAPIDGGKTVCGMALERAQTPKAVIEAIGAPFSKRTYLRERGYRWNPTLRMWSIEVDEINIGQERDWLLQHVYRGQGEPQIRKIAWETRFSRR